MGVDIFVGNPEKISKINELERVIQRLKQYKKEFLKDNESAGVLLLQNRQIGGIYYITSDKEARELMSVPVIGRKPVEIPIKFWPYSYFEDLRKKLKQPTNSY